MMMNSVMHNRQPQRKQLGQVDAKSAYFTSHGMASQSSSQSSQSQKSHIDIGYGGIAASSSYSKQPVTRRNSYTRQRNGIAGSLLFLALWTATLVGGGYYYWVGLGRLEYTDNKEEISHQDEEEENAAAAAMQEARQWKKKYHDLEQQQRQQQQQRSLREQEQHHHHQQDALLLVQNELDSVRDQLKQQEQRTNEMMSKNKNNQLASQQVQQMKRAIQEQSRKAVLEKFGPGPHKVELELNFATEEPDQNWYVVLELAPLEEMPHTVHTFLEQVSRGLYNAGTGGYSFHHNSPLFIMGSTIESHLTNMPDDKGKARQGFIDSGFGTLLFQEYSPTFPHVQNTVGFAKTGPDLYINTRDNTNLHGPGGYAGPDGPGDPCFAKVVNGLDVVEKMHSASSSDGAPLHDGDWKEMQGGPIAVRSIKIIN